MKTKLSLLPVLVLIFSLLLPGCTFLNRPAAIPTYDLAATQTQDALRTEAAYTLAAAMTEAAIAATASAVIPPPSETPIDTATSTLTPIPSETPTPTENPAGTSTGTPTGTPELVIPTSTIVKADYQCNLIRTSPSYKSILQRGEDFDVHWTLLNSGTEIWYYETVSGAYRNGVMLHRYSGSFKLPTAVKPGETFEITIDMQAPLEPGLYSSIWVLKHDSKDFCWFSVDIEVK